MQHLHTCCNKSIHVYIVLRVSHNNLERSSTRVFVLYGVFNSPRYGGGDNDIGGDGGGGTTTTNDDNYYNYNNTNES